MDRVIQEAVSQQWSNLYEPRFSAQSYGFRPGRHAHQALEKCREYISAGYRYAIDMDLEKLIDTVNHSKLIELLSRTVKDSRVVSLIHRYLKGGIRIGQTFEPGLEGVPQSGPLSPMLSNILLNELDKEVGEKRS